jgi:KDO2-lipid IV(A) lauroyltransferase
MRIIQRLEAALIVVAIRILLIVGPVRASNLGGLLARTIGPRLPVNRVAEQNLRRAFPDRSAVERRGIIRGMWDNLGRTTAEMPHLGMLLPLASLAVPGAGWFCSEERLIRDFAAANRSVLFFTGHLGNWEMTLPIAAQLGLKVGAVFRTASNPYVDSLINRLRQRAVGLDMPMFPKGAKGARAAFAHMARGGSLGLLMDQKLNEGIAVPFFGQPAMTAPSLAVLALHFRCPVIPARVDRLGPARFRLVLETPLELPASCNRESDILLLTTQVNKTLERWISERPEAWLWVHRRWPKNPTPSQRPAT